MPELIVKKQEDGLTLEQFLQKRIPSAPQAYLRQLLKKGKIRRTQKGVSAAEPLVVGERIYLPDSGRLRELLRQPQEAPAEVTILYESREILVVDKPAGVAIHASQGHETDNLTARVEQLLTSRGLRYKVAPVHRLDLETSGPVLFGKGRKACSELGKLFMQHQVEKTYLALVKGKTAGSGQLSTQVAAKGKTKPARADFKALQRNERASLLEVTLQTGRQHQIRQQLQQAGHPLFGDKRYRGPCPSDLPRLFLHCHRLAFVDPFSAAPLAIDSPLPEDLANFLVHCDLTLPSG